MRTSHLDGRAAAVAAAAAAQVSQGEDGFPKMTTRDGKSRQTVGRCFIMRRIAKPAPKEYVETVRALLQNTMEAVNKYYAFGSAFSEEF